MTKDRKKIASDGLSTDYYKIPSNKRTISELIEYKNMLPAVGMVFRMCVDLHNYDRVVIDKKLDKMKELINDYKNVNHFEFETDYELPKHVSELRHVISWFSMSKSRGDIFKACFRLGEKDGVDEQYDLNKIIFFIQDLKEMNERYEHI